MFTCGSLIHLLLLVAVISFVVHLVTGPEPRKSSGYLAPPKLTAFGDANLAGCTTES